MTRDTSGALHLILSMQYHLTRRARSREVRLLGGRVPFAFFASSREVAIAPTHQDPQHKVKRSTSGLFHLNLRVLACITRKIAKGCGAFMGQSERLYAEKQPIPQALTHAVDRGGNRPGGGGEPPPRTSRIRGTNRAMIPPPAKPGRFSWEMLAEMLP